MKGWVAVALCCLLCVPALAEVETRAERKAKAERWRYIASTRPKRNEAYLRRENITDEEVRELQAAASSVLPKSIVNIAGVTTECPCEDGPDCSAQVWVVAYKPEKTVGLMFSKVDGHWGIGAVQSWWMQYDQLQASRPKGRAELMRWFEKQEALYAAFPVCGAQQRAPADGPASRARG